MSETRGAFAQLPPGVRKARTALKRGASTGVTRPPAPAAQVAGPHGAPNNRPG
ncbi:hypothetical protein [Streptomyces sp. NBC_01439]|uniref:hypothetical protein n=1 Tax=Streptomyces sp. NBC_01439 TaxID=2903867 RepID=UPI002E2CF2AB|nr:hypothetical protein [Streptomyces sp. NBC_01439]